MIEPARRARPVRTGVVTLAGIEIPAVDETKHFKLLGATGSGKSTATRELLSGALERSDRAIIADPDGGYLKSFYDRYRGDVIPNPFERRSARWDLFGEVEQPYDVEQLTRSLISEGADASSREWRAFARTFLGAILEYCKLENRQDLGEVWRLVSVADVEELQPILAGTAAQPFLGEGIEDVPFDPWHREPRTVRAQIRQRGRAKPLSVRQWVREGKGVLFLPY